MIFPVSPGQMKKNLAGREHDLVTMERAQWQSRHGCKAVISILVVLMTGCAPRVPNESVLVLAVEGITTDDLSCPASHATERSGFSILCHEFIQAKGMVASSTSSLPSLGALLTGLSPQEIRLFTAQDFLSARFVSLAEEAVLAGWQTGYFPASPPLTRRSGFAQGFELADESVGGNRSFRTIEESLNLLLGWMEDARGKNLFAVATLSDLLHPDATTFTDGGETRSQTIESQIEEMDESLFRFFSRLKTSKSWDSSWIFFVGLQGRLPEESSHFPKVMRLKPNQLIAPLFYKPAGKYVKADIKGLWTHAELGQSVRELFDGRRKPVSGEVWTKNFLAKKKDLVMSQGCVSRTEDFPLCRFAFFDEKSYLLWDQGADKGPPVGLLKKVLENRDGLPPLFNVRNLPTIEKELGPSPYQNCVRDFTTTDPERPFASRCQSQVLRLLRELVTASSGRPFSELRSQFLRRCVDLALAHQIFEWEKKQQIGLTFNQDVIWEFSATEELLHRPEFSILRRECQRGLF
ncbi:MAG: hypothetical protein C5B49_15630 [Bdellovibrio sp.]|nr:MAG: hypothetical protein C5B49_15630 [Bdellovibrio sp.]